MRRRVWAAIAAGVFLHLSGGCADSRESTEAKCVRTESQIETLADKLAGDIGDDGWFRRGTAGEETDAWGNRLEIKYRRAGGTETLTVWSNGPDGLPHTKDDLSSHGYRCDNAVVLAEIRDLKSKGRQEAVEGYGRHLTRGLVRGATEGWRDRNRKNDPDPPRGTNK